MLLKRYAMLLKRYTNKSWDPFEKSNFEIKE